MAEERSKDYLYRVAKEFFNVESIVSVQAIHGGHINSTYMIIFPDCRYCLQQINHNVFHSPLGVMNNMTLITNHITKKCVYDGKSKSRSGLNLVRTRYDQYVAIVDGDYWRCTEFIEGGICYDVLQDSHIFNEVGKAVGNFHYMMSDFHSRTIDDSIPFFHDTPRRYKNFLARVEDAKNNNKNRYNECLEDIKFITERGEDLSYIVDGLNNRTIRRRVCHYDTKLSNVMIDEKTGKYMCLIDLDTAMKGAIAYDYGDALRGGASTSQEDEIDLNKVSINLDLVKSFTRGFFSELVPKPNFDGKLEDFISPAEVRSLYEGFRIISIELGMRFLDDYLDNDKYFKINDDRPKHNLERARNQLKLASEVEKNKDKIIKIINDSLKEFKFRKEYLIK